VTPKCPRCGGTLYAQRDEMDLRRVSAVCLSCGREAGFVPIAVETEPAPKKPRGEAHTCAWCSETFYFYASQEPRRRYCSPSCWNAARRGGSARLVREVSA
jgi:hypothetical protein